MNANLELDPVAPTLWSNVIAVNYDVTEQTAGWS